MINVKETKREFLMSLFNQDIKKILDLGCGKGLMSKFFANKGAKIIGIDLNKIVEESPNFKLIEGDIRKENFGEKNDLIIASLILHFLNKNDSLQIIERMKTATSKLGYNLLVCMSDKDENAKKKTEKFYPNIQELIKIYSDWKLIKEISDISEIEDHDNIGPHQHHLNFVLFQNKTE
ncbi:methyltransferase domain-containing protein [Candidatus Pacearchaeota archaeon]|nr:methyltransferase domain-containing protein [Candidatus Pacearchaeota archaeon]